MSESPNKFCFILRGLPGTGKSIVADLLSTLAQTDKSVILRTDDYFSHNNKYQFDRTLLKEAHEATFKSFKEWVEKDTPVIIVDNTNIKIFHYWHYLDYAQRHDYKVAVITMPHNDVSNKELSLRNIHGVDQNTIRRMRQTFAWEIEKL